MKKMIPIFGMVFSMFSFSDAMVLSTESRNFSSLYGVAVSVFNDSRKSSYYFRVFQDESRKALKINGNLKELSLKVTKVFDTSDLEADSPDKIGYAFKLSSCRFKSEVFFDAGMSKNRICDGLNLLFRGMNYKIFCVSFVHEIDSTIQTDEDSP